MRASPLISLLGATAILAQSFTCPPGLLPGIDITIYTIPYTYSQVLSIIGSYGNLTWSGSPDGSVTLTGPDNTVGTTRIYDLVGAHVVETLSYYNKTALGPYEEIHILDLLTVPSANVSFSSPYDATTVVSSCDGRAATFNFTALYCASNVSVAGPLLSQIHTIDAQTVGVFLGGQNFTSCAALNATGDAIAVPIRGVQGDPGLALHRNGTATGTVRATPTVTTAPTAVFTGAVGKVLANGGLIAGIVGVAALLL